MPMPRWLAQFNKRTFNKLEVKRGKRPVLTHVGRSSGKTFRTPLDAHRVAGGYLFIMVYGMRSDWVRNILATGTAQLRAGGQDYDLVAPRVIGQDEAFALLSEDVKKPPGFMKISEFLLMDIAAS